MLRPLTWIRMAFLLGCFVFLICATRLERHEVASLDDPAAGASGAGPAAVKRTAVNGLGFTEAATVDGFVRRDGVLYDLYSLHPLSSSGDFKLEVEKACPT